MFNLLHCGIIPRLLCHPSACERCGWAIQVVSPLCVTGEASHPPCPLSHACGAVIWQQKERTRPYTWCVWPFSLQRGLLSCRVEFQKLTKHI